ncbi:hypothetical protein L596_017547 [Steinernema carpocapsae]|uniref:Uncharacterized protein n=1 Tax=Steinernema carpocapsae TaxID=34508 RepID=A0A4U5N210_STECR|nr:hypothetical protein L596_017547 [Steinernema carpocapsae]
MKVYYGIILAVLVLAAAVCADFNDEMELDQGIRERRWGYYGGRGWGGYGGGWNRGYGGGWGRGWGRRGFGWGR